MRKSVISITKFAAVVAAAVAVSACEAEKSRNPLSPNVAGPIAGVSISPPTPVNPINGAEVLNTAPVRLVFNDGSTNGERPLFYVVELASDAAFTNKVFAQSKVTPGSTQTSIVVDAALTAERTYYWRAKADDGANKNRARPSPSSASSCQSSLRPRCRCRRSVAWSPHRRDRCSWSTTLASRAAPAAWTTGWRFPSARRSRGSLSSRASSAAAARRRAFRCRTCRRACCSLACRGVQRHNRGPLVAHAELPDARCRCPSAWSVARAFAGPATTLGRHRHQPAPRGPLPLPDMSAVVYQVAAQFTAAALRNWCGDKRRSMGENRWRHRSPSGSTTHRWGYNGKRGNMNDASQDVIDYHWGRGRDQGSPDVYALDIIVGHCRVLTRRRHQSTSPTRTGPAPPGRDGDGF